MKIIFTLLLSTLFSLSLLAYDGTRLTISSVSTNKLFAEVDGRRYNLDGNTVSIRDIRFGYHSVKVYREVKRRNSRWFDFGIGNNSRFETIYSNRVFLKDGYHFDILINCFGKVLLDEHRIDRNDDWYNDDDDYDNRYPDGNRNRDNNDYGNNKDDRNYDDNHNNRDDKDYDNNRNDRDYNDGNGYSRAISNNDFTAAKETLRKEWMENSRMTLAKQIIDRNYFTSQQVKEMLLLFTFENNRLDIAKYAYSKTVDKSNYFVVNDAFTFNSNKDELARYIRDYK